MAYTLQALIAPTKVLQNAGQALGRIAPLNADLFLLPLTAAVCKEVGIPVLPLTDEGENLPEEFLSRLAALSANGKLAYVEAEYFGGVGTQACVMYAYGAPVGVPVVSNGAINEALRFLGVVALGGRDEFSTVGLDAHHNTASWC